jgi:hypothetical protein
MKKFWTVAGILVFCAGMGWGASYQWIGSASGNWTDNNWADPSTPTVPLGSYPGSSTGDTVIIPNGSYTVALEVDLALLASLEIGNNVILNIKTHDLNVGTLTLIGSTKVNSDSTGDILTTANLNATGSAALGGSAPVQMGGGTVGVTLTDVTVITTSGSLSLAGNLDATGKDVLLDAPGGSVSGSGVIRGNTLTVNAKDGINLDGANAVSPVSLTNSTSGDISYESAAAVTVEASNNASGRNIDILLNAGELTVDGSGITANNGSITLTANTIAVDADIKANNGAITLIVNIFTASYAIPIAAAKISIQNRSPGTTIGLGGGVGAIQITTSDLDYIQAAVLEIGSTTAGNITVGASPSTSASTLVLRTGAGVSGGGNINVSNLAIESDDPVSITLDSNVANVAVKTNSTDATGTGAISLTKSSGGFNIASIERIDGLSCGSNGIIILSASGNVTQSATGIIDTPGTTGGLLLTGGTVTLDAANTVKVLAATNTGGCSLEFTNSVPLTVGTVGGTSGITMPGGPVTLSAGTNAITLASNISSTLSSSTGGDIMFSSPVVLSADVEIDSGSTSTTGGNITLAAVSGNRNLTLKSGSGTISVTGNVGSSSPRLGAIAVSSSSTAIPGVTFSGGANTIYAASYTQTGTASTTFYATQNYTGNFDFAGKDLTVSNGMTVGGITTIDNTGAFYTVSGGTISSAGTFKQKGSGGNTVGANITVSSAGAKIEFATSLTIAPADNGTVTFDSSAGDGPITLGGTVSSAVINRSLTLDSGAGEVILSNTVNLSGSFTKAGTGKTTVNNNVTSNNDDTANNYGISFGGKIELGNNITLSTGTGTAGGNITISGMVDGYTSSTQRNLTLTAGAGNINVTGVVGHDGSSETDTIRLGTLSIVSAANATFSNNIYAASFSQTTGTGTTTFNGAQDYTGGFNFNGTNLTVNSTLTTTTGAANTVTINNSGAFTTGTSGDISAGGAFSQTGGGTNSLAANITTSNTNLANASISFAKKITLAGSVVLDSSAGDGTITLPFDSGVSVGNTVAGNFDLKSGNGNIIINGSVTVNGTVTQTGANATTKLFGDITTDNQTISFASPVELNNDITIDSGTGAGNITLAAVSGDVANRGLTLNSGVGTISVTGDMGSSGIRLGALVVSSSSIAVPGVTFNADTNSIYAASYTQTGVASTVFNAAQDYTGSFSFTGTNLTVNNTFSAAGDIAIPSAADVNFTSTAVVSAANFTQSVGTGTTTFDGTQNYTGGFSFTGTNLTVNNTLQTDTDTSGDGAIAVTVSGIFTVGTSGNIQPGGAGGTLTVTGITTNNGAITAGPVPTGDAITFNGNYTVDTSIGTIIGNATTDPNIVFKGNAVFYDFANNGDTVQFSGPSSTIHDVSIISGGTAAFAGVVIDTDNTVTVLSGTTIIQDDSNTLTLKGNAVLDTTVGNWHMGTSSPTPVPAYFTGGFQGINGTLVLEDEANLKTEDFYNSSGTAHTIRISGIDTTVTASDNVEINREFVPDTGFTLKNSTIDWTGAADTTGNLATGTGQEIGNLTLSASGGTLTLGADLHVAGSITIGAGKTLDAGSDRKITIKGDWDQSGGGIFKHRQGEVEFVDGTTFTITGNTTWYNFTCTVPGAKLIFSNYEHPGDLHTIYPGGTFTVKGGSGSGQGITLTRKNSGFTDTPQEKFPKIGEDELQFWHFKLGDPASSVKTTLVLEHVQIEYSWAVHRIVIPIKANGVEANYNSPLYPTQPHLWDYNWIKNLGFVYAFTEDANHNGRIDRIRMQATVDLFFAGTGDEWKNKLVVEVEGYEVSGYSADTTLLMDTIWVNVTEKNHSDGDARPPVRITENTGILEPTRRESPLTTLDIKTGRDWTWIETTDTVVPRINYTLALPEGDGVFVQISEPVTSLSFSGTTDITATGPFPVTEASGGMREFIAGANAQELSLVNLAGGNKLIKITATDFAEPADVIEDEPGIEPKYPEKPGNYHQYSVSIEDAGPGSWKGVKPPYPLVATEYAPSNKDYADPASPASHRLTDLLISLPPARAEDTRYFVWPIWAQNDDPATFVGQRLNPRPGDMNIDGSPVPERGLIWNFTGGESLQRKGDITVQALQNGALNQAAAQTHEMVFAQNVGEDFLAAAVHGPEGLWLPKQGMPAGPFSFLNMTPKLFDALSTPAPAAVDVPPSAARSIYNFSIPGTEYGLGMLEFYFRLEKSPADLYAVRLDTAAGVIPADWYRRVKPFTFNLRDLVLQRGGVTILNNVIDPTRGERTFVHYHLVNSGRVTVQVFTLDGTLVQVLQRGSQEAGEYDAIWDGRNRQGRPVARGMYFIRVVAPDIDEIRKVMVVK